MAVNTVGLLLSFYRTSERSSYLLLFKRQLPTFLFDKWYIISNINIITSVACKLGGSADNLRRRWLVHHFIRIYSSISSVQANTCMIFAEEKSPRIVPSWRIVGLPKLVDSGLPKLLERPLLLMLVADRLTPFCWPCQYLRSSAFRRSLRLILLS